MKKMISRGILTALLCAAAATTAAAEVRSFEIGPGIVGPQGALEDGGDTYLKYQWGFHNFGQLQIDSQRLKNTEYRLSGEINLSEHTVPEEVVTAVSGIDIDMEHAWPLYSSKAEKRQVVIALIDTGVDVNHEELRDAIWINADEVPGDGIDNDGNGYVDDVNGWNFFDGNNQIYGGMQDYHGTHAAGTMSAKWGNGGIAGMTDNSWIKIMPLKVLGFNGVGKDSAVVEAIRYAEANGADICNLSFGGYQYSAEVEQAIRESSMLFVAAAGNGDESGTGFSIDERPVYPAAYTCDNLITVANLSFDGNLHSSSNCGTVSVDLAAPGSYILSTVPAQRYAFLSGTSMSAPIVTAAAAMVYSYRTDLALGDIKALLLRNVKKLDSLAGKTASGGMLDVYQALLDGQTEAAP